MVCTWLREICSCSSLPVLPGPAWVLLSKIYKPFVGALYIGRISYPWLRDTGKYAAQGPNIWLPEAPLMPPEARRAIYRPLGRHIDPRAAYFPVAQGQGCDIDIII